MESLEGQLGGSQSPQQGKCAELARLVQDLRDTIWNAKDVFTPDPEAVFAGYHGSKQKLQERVLELRSQSKPTFPTRLELESTAVAVLDTTSSPVDLLALPTPGRYAALAVSELWGKSIAGSKDAAVAPLIERLGNGDWVKVGTHYLEHSDGACPFCQQQVPQDLAQQLAEFFDGGYEADLA